MAGMGIGFGRGRPGWLGMVAVRAMIGVVVGHGAMAHRRMFGGAAAVHALLLCFGRRSFLHGRLRRTMPRMGVRLRDGGTGEREGRQAGEQHRRAPHAASPFGRTLTTRIMPACM